VIYRRQYTAACDCMFTAAAAVSVSARTRSIVAILYRDLVEIERAKAKAKYANVKRIYCTVCCVLNARRYRHRPSAPHVLPSGTSHPLDIPGGGAAQRTQHTASHTNIIHISYTYIYYTQK